MKHKLRVVTGREYEYIETEMEGSPKEAIEVHKELQSLISTEGGKPDKEFNATLDKLLDNKGLEGDPGEVLGGLTYVQRETINHVKKAFKRKKYVPPTGYPDKFISEKEQEIT